MKSSRHCFHLFSSFQSKMNQYYSILIENSIFKCYTRYQNTQEGGMHNERLWHFVKKADSLY